MITRPLPTHDNALAHALHHLLKRAVDGAIATSASLYVGLGANPSRHLELHVGASDRALRVPTSEHTMYDLASLTKIIGTTFALARAVSNKRIELSERPFKSWPHATISSLLAHRAGVSPHVHFYTKLDLAPRQFQKNYHRIITELFNTPLSSPTANRVYSDLGFMALGYFLEQRLENSLFSIFTDAWNFARLPQSFTWFASEPPTYYTTNGTIAYCGYCPYRKNHIAGQVHDPNCYFMGGLAGHAGIFGNLASVAAAGHWLLHAYNNPSNQFERTVALFARDGLGFDKTSSTGTTRNLSRSGFGHFGYTGTSLWIDPDAPNGGLVIALLTNRVAKSTRPEGIFWLRLKVNQLLAKYGATLLIQ